MPIKVRQTRAAARDAAVQDHDVIVGQARRRGGQRRGVASSEATGTASVWPRCRCWQSGRDGPAVAHVEPRQSSCARAGSSGASLVTLTWTRLRRRFRLLGPAIPGPGPVPNPDTVPKNFTLRAGSPTAIAVRSTPRKVPEPWRRRCPGTRPSGNASRSSGGRHGRRGWPPARRRPSPRAPGRLRRPRPSGASRLRASPPGWQLSGILPRSKLTLPSAIEVDLSQVYAPASDLPRDRLRRHPPSGKGVVHPGGRLPPRRRGRPGRQLRAQAGQHRDLSARARACRPSTESTPHRSRTISAPRRSASR